MRDNDDIVGSDTIGINEKVSFLSNPQVYPEHQGQLICRETHMSWVFIADSFVYKLKKPVSFPYLDYSTLERREIACRTELKLNRRLAPTVYVDVVPLTLNARGLTLGGEGAIVDWLVVMRRLDDTLMLEHVLPDGSFDRRKLDRLATTLAIFYAHARPCLGSVAAHLGAWRRRLAENRRVLSSPQLALSLAVLTRIDRAQRRFINERRGLLAERVTKRRIVDGHGDLRPEHIWLGEPIAVIDCLEFSSQLRAIDPFDELAFLSVECDRLGVGGAGRNLANRIARILCDDITRPLQAFYRCYRATMRARLSFAHLLESNPRTPNKWPRLGRWYLGVALREAFAIERYLENPDQDPFPKVENKVLL